MAVPAKRLPNESYSGENPELTIADVREAAARLYGQGFKRPQIARAMLEYLSPSRSIKAARLKLRKWESQKEFRDLIWKHAVQKLDMQTPLILEGIGRAAKRGRVDAAKLALAVAERHTDKSDMPQVVELRLTQMDRPDRQAIRPRGGGEIEAASTTDEDPG